MTIENVLEILTFHPLTRVKVNMFKDGYLATVVDTGRKGISDIPLEIVVRDVTAMSVESNTIVLEFNGD